MYHAKRFYFRSLTTLLLIVACVVGFSEAPTIDIENMDLAEWSASKNGNAAMVLNAGRDGETCELFDPNGDLVGVGRSTMVINGNRYHLHCNGEFLLPPPKVIRDAVGCPGGAAGSIVITPGGRFAARCNGDV